MEDWKERLAELQQIEDCRIEQSESVAVTPKQHKRKIEFFGKLFILEYFESWVENGEVKLRLNLTECK